MDDEEAQVARVRDDDGDPTVVLDCSGCETGPLERCEDCVVRFLCERDLGEAVVIDVDELRAIRLLGRVGLVPRRTVERRTG